MPTNTLAIPLTVWLFVSSGICHAAKIPSSFVEWHPLSEAKELAQRDGKLLIVVQGPDDCSIPLDECIFPKEFAGSAFPDNGLAGFYEFRAVLSYRPTGQVRPLVKELDAKQKANLTTYRRKRGNVVTYFCTPKGKVLHFLVGFPTPELMQSHTDWSFDLLGQLDDLSKYEKATTVRNAHQRKLASQTIGPMANWSALLSDDVVDKPSLIKLAVSVAKQRDQLILAQYGMEWNLKEQRILVTTLRKQAELTPESAHLLMQGYPMTPLSEIEQTIYMAFTKQSFSRPPVRRQLIRDWFETRRQESRPIMVVVTSAKTPNDIPEDDDLNWQPKRKSIQAQLADIAIIELNRNELICLLVDAGLKPPTNASQIKYLVFNPDQDEPVMLDQRKKESQLQRVLAKAISHD